MEREPRAHPPESGEAAPWTSLHRAPMPSGEAWGVGGSAIREVPYASPPGFRPLLLDLYLPAQRPCPAVVWVHGGAFLMGSRSLLPPSCSELTLFRPSAGGGDRRRLDRLPAQRRGAFPAQLHDVKAAIRWLRARGPEIGIDPDRIAVWGESAGGHLAAMATVTSGDRGARGRHRACRRVHPAVTAGVDWYGPTDFAAMDRDAPADSAMTHDAPASPESLLIGAPVQERAGPRRRGQPLHLCAAGDAAAARPARHPRPARPVRPERAPGGRACAPRGRRHLPARGGRSTTSSTARPTRRESSIRRSPSYEAPSRQRIEQQDRQPDC